MALHCDGRIPGCIGGDVLRGLPIVAYRRHNLGRQGSYMMAFYVVKVSI